MSLRCAGISRSEYRIISRGPLHGSQEMAVDHLPAVFDAVRGHEKQKNPIVIDRTEAPFHCEYSIQARILINIQILRFQFNQVHKMKSEMKEHRKIVLVKAIPGKRGPEVLIYGTPSGLKMLAERLVELAELDQESMGRLPEGVGHHIDLRAGIELAEESDLAVVGRIDGKGNGDYSWLLLQMGDGSWTTVKP